MTELTREQKLDILEIEMKKHGVGLKFIRNFLLNDMLLFLEKLGYGYVLTSKGIMTITKLGYKNEIYGRKLDLSLPYLSEQSEETINGLYEVVLLSKQTK